MYDMDRQLLSSYELLTNLSEKWEGLDTDKKNYIASTIAGTNQLNNFLALMNNFDHAAEATETALNSAGSAARENERYMQGLEAKTQLLKGTFKTLANDVINSNLVKGLLDLANILLKIIDTPVGVFATQVVLLSTAFMGLSQAIEAMNLKKFAQGIIGSLGAFGPILGGLIVALPLVIELFDAFTTSTSELEGELATVNANLQSYQAEADKLSEKAELSESEKARLAYLNAMIEAEKELQKETARRLYLAKNETIYDASVGDNYYKSPLASNVERQTLDVSPYATITEEQKLLQDIYNLQYYKDQIADLEQQMLATQDPEEIAALGNEIKVIKGYYNDLLDETKPKVEEFVSLIDSMGEEAPDSLIELRDAFAELYSDTEKQSSQSQIPELNQDMNETGEEAESTADKIKSLSSAYNTLSKAVDEYNSTGKISYDTLANLLTLGEDYLSLLDFQNGQLVINEESLNEYTKELKQQAIAEVKANAVERIRALFLEEELNPAIENTGEVAQNATTGIDSYIDSLNKGIPVLFGFSAGVAGVIAGIKGIENGASNVSEDVLNEAQAIWNEALETIKAINSADFISNDINTGSGSVDSDTTVDIFAERQEIIDETIQDLEHEIFLLEKQGASVDVLAEKYKQLQEYLHKEADWFRNQGLDENSDYIQNLQQQWWSYADEITSLYDKLKEEWEESHQATIDWLQENIDSYELLFASVSDKAQEEIDALEAQKDLLQQQNDELDEQIRLEEALDALARAQQTRVLVYKDGRFQYVNDIDEVSQAQTELENIKQEQELQDRLDNIDKEIEYWEKYKEEWGSVVDNYEKEQDKLLLAQKFGIDLESENWQERLGNLAQYVSEYNALMSRLTNAQNMTFGGSSSGIDWSKIWWDAENDPTITEEKRLQIQNWAHSQKAQEMQGTGAKFDIASGSWKYASGTTSAEGGISLVGEKGAELRVLNKGDGVLPANVTRNLWSWGATTPDEFMTDIGNKESSQKSLSILIENLNLPEVKDGLSFVEYMKNNIWRRAVQLTV